MIKTIEHGRLLELVHYNPDTGVFFRLIKTNSRNSLGDIFGSPCRGYLAGMLDGRTYRLHRLAWFYMNKAWPVSGIDHINGIKSDNRMENLREATQAENCQNMKISKRNTSGYLGVSYFSSRCLWKATITINMEIKHLGYFPTPELAFMAYSNAKQESHRFNPSIREGKK